MAEPYPLIVVVGPTASGKSVLAIALAQALNGEVLACDSTQVYRYFDIGTGKVPPASQQGVPHHLTDLLEPDELFTAGDYQRRARAVLAEVRGRRRLPIVTAGTGLYLRALLEGLSPLPPRSPELRARLHARVRERGAEYLHRMLSRIDPNAAKEIGPRDTPKLVRALEVCFSASGAQTRRSRTELFAQGRARLEGYAVTKLGLLPPRAQLYARIEERVEQMLAAGWLEEMQRLLTRFPAYAEASAGGPAHAALKPFQFLGYRQLLAYIRTSPQGLKPVSFGDLYGGVETPPRQDQEPWVSLKEAVKQIKHETRQYAKRQITWFRKERGVKWFAGFGDAPGVQDAVLRFLEEAEPVRAPSNS